jgi:cytochrome c556
MRRFALVSSVAVTAVIGFGAISSMAQDQVVVINERLDTMKRQGEDLRAIRDYVKGVGDQATALAKVNELLAIAPKLSSQFPPGTGMAEFPGKTNARPNIWQDWDKFKERPAALQSEEQKLAAAIKSGDKQAVGSRR